MLGENAGSTLTCLAMTFALLCGAGAAAAQPTALRDPTQPPLAYGAQPASVRDPIDTFKPEHLVIVDGRRYLMWQGYRYGVGDSVLGARIERIGETEVWMRAHDGVRKLPLFAGIEKRPPRGPAPGTPLPGLDATPGQTQ